MTVSTCPSPASIYPEWGPCNNQQSFTECGTMMHDLWHMFPPTLALKGTRPVNFGSTVGVKGAGSSFVLVDYPRNDPASKDFSSNGLNIRILLHIVARSSNAERGYARQSPRQDVKWRQAGYSQ